MQGERVANSNVRARECASISFTVHQFISSKTSTTDVKWLAWLRRFLLLEVVGSIRPVDKVLLQPKEQNNLFGSGD